MCRMRQIEDEVKRSGCEAARSRKRKCLKKGQKYLVLERIFLSVEQILKAKDTGGTGVSPES